MVGKYTNFVGRLCYHFHANWQFQRTAPCASELSLTNRGHLLFVQTNVNHQNVFGQHDWGKKNGLKDTYVALGVKLYQELFPLEAELPDLGPGEGVDLGEVLEDEDPHASHR